MLTGHEEQTAESRPAISPNRNNRPSRASQSATATVAAEGAWARMLRIEWLGQTAASLCWLASVLAYGVGSYGDGLQLAAASAWFVANVASIAAPRSP